jgi:hypothetical protein
MTIRAHETPDNDRATLADRFLDAVLDKGTLWLLAGVGILAGVVVGVQIGIAS